MEYNVLWIDDLCNDSTGRDFIGYAEQEDVNITAFESHEEGIAHLLKNLDKFHAVILDAKVKEKQDDTKLGLAGLRASRDRLIQINEEMYLPWFIFTGQPDYQASDEFRDSYGDFYIKGEDNDKLLIEIKERTNNKSEYIIQKKYHDVFAVCNTRYYMLEAKCRIMDILKNIEEPRFTESTKDLFNPIRKVIELLFAAFNKFQILPDEVYNGSGWINNSCRFLSGKHKDYTLKTEIFPEIVSSTLWHSLNIIQDASHVDDKLQLKIDKHVQLVNTNYLYNGIAFQVLDSLVWFKQFVDLHPDKEKNKELYTFNEPHSESLGLVDWIKGQVYEGQNGWGRFISECGKIELGIPKGMMNELELQVGNSVKLIRKTENEKHIKDLRKL